MIRTAGITEVAQPIGPVLALTPLTNPTSTTIFKALICLKTRNPGHLQPAPRGAEVLPGSRSDHAGGGGGGGRARPTCIQWICTRRRSSISDAVMRHRRLALILATGTSNIVRRAQLSGTPTLGVGPGNVPVYIHPSADIPFAARMIVHSKTFDNGTVCASEQAVVVEPEVDQQPASPDGGARRLLLHPGADAGPRPGLLRLAPPPAMRADVVGQPARAIAEQGRVLRPGGHARLLVAEPDGVGPRPPALLRDPGARFWPTTGCRTTPRPSAICRGHHPPRRNRPHARALCQRRVGRRRLRRHGRGPHPRQHPDDRRARWAASSTTLPLRSPSPAAPGRET